MNYFVSLQTNICVEREKNIFQRNNRKWMNWGKLRSENYYLYIFCFLLTIIIIYSFIYLYACAHWRRGGYAPVSLSSHCNKYYCPFPIRALTFEASSPVRLCVETSSSLTRSAAPHVRDLGPSPSHDSRKPSASAQEIPILLRKKW